ncbi:unnamed protein product [Paramecium sonneborni]|uniref:Uncharacterized protein n=1 Tax=Paramecium sonneborni TaxID=65129 RepID=A0A8S1LCN3_9CILI|nr:unnamed protein product [Paramecium sonneborni]
MKVSNNASNSNNFKLRIFLKSQSKGESSSLYTILKSQKFVFGDDEKNHKTSKPLILYDDTSERQKSTTTSSCSSNLKKLTKRITQLTDSEINVQTPYNFYQIIDNYYDQYINIHFQKKECFSQEKTTKKIERLYTEQSELKTNKQKQLKQYLTQAQNFNKSENTSVKQKLIRYCKKNIKNTQTN